MPHVRGAGPGTPVYLIKLAWFEFQSFQQLLVLADWQPSVRYRGTVGDACGESEDPERAGVLLGGRASARHEQRGTGEERQACTQPLKPAPPRA